MSAAFRAGKNFQIYIPTRAGGLVQRSTGTGEKRVVRAMQKLVQELRDNHRWALLEAITSGERKKRLTLDRLYKESIEDPTLKRLEGDLSTPDVVPLIPDWLASLDSELGARASGKRSEYEVAVRSFTGESCRASRFTLAEVHTWLPQQTGSRATRRAKLYRLSSFATWLVQRGVLASNPIAGRALRKPKKGAPRIRYESADVDAAICDEAQTEELEAFFALVHATGADVSAALTMRRRDVDVTSWTCHVPGTKTARRNRHGVEIEAWAHKRLKAYLLTRKGKDLLFPSIDRDVASRQHKKACDEAKVENYWLKDARHSVAVRMIHARRTLHDVSLQLGSSLYTVATVYAEFWKSGPTTNANANSGPESAPLPLKVERR
jgi:integrase